MPICVATLLLRKLEGLAVLANLVAHQESHLLSKCLGDLLIRRGI